MAKPIYRLDEEELARRGITDKIEIKEDGLRTDPEKGYFEWWYFDAHLDDGSTVVIVFLTKSIMDYKGPMEPGLHITITRPDGKKLEEYPTFKPAEFKASRERCDVQIGPNRIQGDLRNYSLHARGDELAVDLTFTGTAPPWRPGDGKAYYGDLDHYFAWLPSIPYGTVKGTLGYDGKTHQVKGSGYHDHNWGNLSLPRVMDHWYWGRARVKDFTLIFVEQITHKRYGSKKHPVFYLAKGDQILTGEGDYLSLKKEDFIRHSDGRKYPEKLDFHWEHDGDSVHIALRNPEIIDAMSLLAKFPPWKQKLLRLFANPYYFRFNAEMDLDIRFGDIRVHEKGTSLYEMMILN
jgi:hypothetical protein